MATKTKTQAYWKGFYSEALRLDAKKCAKGTACGNACIPKGRQCRQASATAEQKARTEKIAELSSEGEAPKKAPEAEAAQKPAPKQQTAAKPQEKAPQVQADKPGKLQQLAGKVKAKVANLANKVKAATEGPEEPQDATEREQELLKKGPLKSLRQVRAVTTYTGEKYEIMNRCARKLAKADECREVIQINKDLNRAIKSLPGNPEGKEFYRGISLTATDPSYKKMASMFRNLKVGDVFKDDAVSSYSEDEYIAAKFIERQQGDLPIYLVSRSKRLADISQYSSFSNEKESVLPGGHKQRVTKVEQDANALYIYLDDA